MNVYSVFVPILSYDYEFILAIAEILSCVADIVCIPALNVQRANYKIVTSP